MRVKTIEELADTVIALVRQDKDAEVIDFLVENVGVSDENLKELQYTLGEYIADVNAVNKNVRGNKRLALLLGWSFEVGKMQISDPQAVLGQFIKDMNEIAGIGEKNG